MSQIVSAVGTSRQVYHSHFADRDSAVMAVLERDVLEPLVAAIAEVGEDASCRDLLTAVISTLAGWMDLLCNVLDSPVQSCFERMLTGPLHPLVSHRIAHFLQENDASLTQDQIDDVSVYLGGGVIAAMFHCLDTFQGVDDSVQRILTILSLGLSAAGASGSPYDNLPREGIGEDQPRQVMA
ncbi:hypothetical protein [Corynebacterium senegalense]|uniref:hypothetical protein n=1 Tax=Corynebacterium senegalense TaxID=2080750 RepID=UPI0011C0793F|nr:hypothetical protein [Corynebacterium senegalense]